MREDNWSNRGSGRICERCMFYKEKRAPEDGKIHVIVGRCRRHAPVSNEGYPVVFPDDWCGDFKLDETKV